MRSLNAANLNIKDLKNSFSFTKRANIDGQNINVTTESEKYKVMSGVKRLVDNGLVTYGSSGQDSSLTSDAAVLLSALGVTVDLSLSKDIDLKSDASDNEVIANPNIKDKNFKNMKGKQITAKDKFPNTDSSFYTADSKKRQFLQAAAATESISANAAVDRMAADVSENLLSPSVSMELSQLNKK